MSTSKNHSLNRSHNTGRDANPLSAEARRLIRQANDLRMFTLTARPTAESADTKKAAKAWIREAEETIGSMSAGDMLAAISYYDLIHRIAYDTPAKEEYVTRYKLAAFDSYIGGDTTVDQYDLFHAITLELNRRNRAFFGMPLQWASATLEKWHRQFRTGECLDPTLSDYDITRRVDALLAANLSAFEAANEPAFKRTLLTRHPHLTTT